MANGFMPFLPPGTAPNPGVTIPDFSPVEEKIFAAIQAQQDARAQAAAMNDPRVQYAISQGFRPMANVGSVTATPVDTGQTISNFGQMAGALSGAAGIQAPGPLGGPPPGPPGSNFPPINQNGGGGPTPQAFGSNLPPTISAAASGINPPSPSNFGQGHAAMTSAPGEQFQSSNFIQKSQLSAQRTSAFLTTSNQTPYPAPER